MLRLITIPISHFCEKARWALDRSQLAYREEPHLQLFHYVATFRAAGSYTAPVLVHEDGVLRDSNDIMRWVDGRTDAGLYPTRIDPEVDAWVRRFDDKLGVPGRLIMYQESLARPEMMLRFISHRAPAYQPWLMKRGFPLARAFAKRRMGVSAERAEEARDHCLEVFDEVAERMRDGRRYFFGEHFTAADLTFAALAAPLILPSAYGVPLPELQEIPGRYAELVRTFRAHDAGRYAAGIYAHERPPSPLRATSS